MLVTTQSMLMILCMAGGFGLGGNLGIEALELAIRQPAAEPVVKEFHSTFLVDSCGMLTKGQAEELAEYLQQHAQQSLIDLYVVIHQSKNRNVQAPEAAEAGGVVLFYESGSPDRARLLALGKSTVLGKGVTESLRDSCIELAAAATEREEQLGKFIEGMTSQLKAVEKALANVKSYQQSTVSPERPSSPAIQLLVFHRLGVLLALCIALGGVWSVFSYRGWKARRALEEAPVHLPGVKIHPRLGAPYGGGNQAVMSFGQPGETTLSWRLSQRLRKVIKRMRVAR